MKKFDEQTAKIDAYLQKQFTASFSLDAILPTRHEFVVDSILVDRNTSSDSWLMHS